MIGEWRATLAAHAREWGLPPGGEWSFLVYNNFQPTYSGLNVFWFHNRDRNPLVVTKTFPEPVVPQQEYRNLVDAYACVPGAVPKPLALYREGTLWALWMAGVAGSPLTADRLSDGLADGLAEALAAIQSGVGARRPVNPHRYEEQVRAPLAFALERSSALAGLCRQTLARYAEDRLERTPVLPQHADLCGGNIIVDGRKSWAIVDWELLGMVDLPFYDLVRLLFALGCGTAPDRWNEAVQRQAPRLVAHYSRALGIASGDLAPLLPLLLANWHFHQPLPEGKGLALAALQDYFSRPAAWERALLR